MDKLEKIIKCQDTNQSFITSHFSLIKYRCCPYEVPASIVCEYCSRIEYISQMGRIKYLYKCNKNDERNINGKDK